ncbi:ACT domain-containing protein [Rhizobium leguminosarum]|uniref:ACT domain-containing protein n=1 Tax=Rhizobium ruizarguesonis TaxID=2081791 RepID=UPI0013DFCA57|nr:ACT domain-containing protein [Rhizobium ruizarguesonis]
MVGVILKRQHGEYTIAQLPGLSPIPSWCDGDGFVSVSRGADELSVICLKNRVPARVTSDGDWACFKLEGPTSPRESGSVHSIVRPVAENGIEVFVVSTFGGEYIFMRNRDAAASIDCLTAAGHHIA